MSTPRSGWGGSRRRREGLAQFCEGVVSIYTPANPANPPFALFLKIIFCIIFYSKSSASQYPRHSFLFSLFRNTSTYRKVIFCNQILVDNILET